MRATPAEPRSEPLPTLAGRYRVVSTVARDEKGTIHLAWDLRTERWRTLQAAQGEAQARRLLRSIAAVRKLDHPTVERVLDLGEEGSVTFAVRERMLGSAADHLPLAPALAVRLALRVADALVHAHGHGVVHGHVRPSVVRWGDEGPLLTGWGASPDVDASTTGREGELWAHLAPELRQRWRPDARSDVYALGALLYTLVAGHHQADLFAAELLGSALAPLPEPLLALVIASCAYDPADRPEGALPFHARLLAHAGTFGPIERSPWPTRPLPSRPPENELEPDEGVRALVAAIGPSRTPGPSAYVSPPPSLERTPLSTPQADELPAYVDRRFGSPEPSPVWRGEVERLPPRAPAVEPPSRLRSVAAGLLLLVLVLVGIGAAVWVSTRHARAGSALISVVVRETSVAARIAEVGPRRGAVEEAWFRFSDDRSPENAAAYVRLAAEASATEGAPEEVRRSIARMQEALEAWESTR